MIDLGQDLMGFAIDWQTTVALCIVAVSVLAFVKVFAKSLRNDSKSGCGNCPNSSSTVKAKQLVTISTKNIGDRKA